MCSHCLPSLAIAKAASALQPGDRWTESLRQTVSPTVNSSPQKEPQETEKPRTMLTHPSLGKFLTVKHHHLSGNHGIRIRKGGWEEKKRRKKRKECILFFLMILFYKIILVIAMIP